MNNNLLFGELFTIKIDCYMNKQFKEFQELTTKAGNYMEYELSYSLKTLDAYKRAWRRIRTFMFENKINRYDKKVEELLLKQAFGDSSKKELSPYERFVYNGAKMLTQFQQTGHIDPPNYHPSRNISTNEVIFTGALGQLILDFLAYKKAEGLAKNTIRSYERLLAHFFKYCQKNEINSIQEIDLVIILQYINDLDNTKKTAIYNALWMLRTFFRYIFEQGLTLVNYSVRMPRYKAVSQAKLPSTYSKEEIEKLISTIQRDSPMGKRNYAIILLAARLGLRASDISRLKFEHLNWDTHQIRLKQVKTQKELILPILADVGNAIIDYLKYSRPQSKESFIFLTGRPPYCSFKSSNVVTHVVQRAFLKSGIDIKGKRFGPHSLRHSLSSRLLEERTVLPVITEILGHKNTNSTRYYLRIDLTSMEQCMLDVSAVSINFYQQKGGIFYE